MKELVPEQLDVRGPQYAFKWRDHTLAEAYEQGFSIKEFMPVNSVGIVTAKDTLVTDFTQAALTQKISRFVDSSKTDDQVRSEFFPYRTARKYPPGDSRGWKLPAARAILQATDWHQDITPVTYRPFDTRTILYRPDMVDWGREQVMRHMLAGENLGLVFCRGDAEDNSASGHVTNTICDSRSWTRPGMQSIDYLAPLYLYLCPENGNVSKARTVNFDPALWDRLKTLAPHPDHGTPDELQTLITSTAPCTARPIVQPMPNS